MGARGFTHTVSWSLPLVDIHFTLFGSGVDEAVLSAMALCGVRDT
jgi:hypothetical protein